MKIWQRESDEDVQEESEYVLEEEQRQMAFKAHCSNWLEQKINKVKLHILPSRVSWVWPWNEPVKV